MQRIVENHSISACQNELLSLEVGGVRTMVQLHATAALLTALDNTKDAVEITNENYEVQVSDIKGS